MNKAIGIDFGTSNSTVGFWDAGSPRLVRLEGERTVIPSAIFYDFDEEVTLFGHTAIAAYIDQYEGRLLRALKSVLGSSLVNETTQIGGKRLPFKAIIGEFLWHLKTKAESELGFEMEDVVLGRPVRFVDGDDAADIMAQNQLAAIAALCGFKNIQFQFEPIAAALDYEQTVTGEELVLIADIGGGTSDFSLIRLSPDRCGKADRKADILANTGVHVGGTDLDRKLSLNQIMPLLGYGTQQRARPELHLPSAYFHDLATWHKIVFLYNRKSINAIQDIRNLAAHPELVDRFLRVLHRHEGHRLAGDAEKAKMALSHADEVKLALDYVESGLATSLNKATFEETIDSERAKISDHIRQCLAQADVTPSQINTIFLTGGSTAVPSVLAACTSVVPEAQIVEGDKVGSVGLGLAIDAATKFGAPSSSTFSFNKRKKGKTP